MLKQKEKEDRIRREARRQVAKKEWMQHEIANQHEQRLAETRNRRLRIAETRKEHIEAYSPVVVPLQVETKLMMHRHIHHHVHYHNPESTDDHTRSPSTAQALPAMASNEVARGMRRSPLAQSASGLSAVNCNQAPDARAR